MKRKIVYTDAPPEVSAAIARGRIISREEAGLPPAEFFRTATEVRSEENGMVTIRLIPSQEFLNTEEGRKYLELKKARDIKEAEIEAQEAKIVQMPKKAASFFSGKVAAL